ncbi:DUF3237 family protein [Bradyrhizobium diazoefficiens]|nr:DUF3237 domain-containing protein [Bradyrhizobium diazoefficiens]QQO20640.1 DUF3237 family protein [Bradyrhizobium diazoefficiens]
MIQLRPLFNLSARVDIPIELGPDSFGRHRRIVKILGGAFVGARLRGSIHEVGADWQSIRPDGTAELDIRCILETDDGALIDFRGIGLRHGPSEVFKRISEGETVDPSSYYFREVIRFETSAPAYDWMTRIFSIAAGTRLKNDVHLDVFEVL